MTTILTVCGSLRRASIHATLLATAEEQFVELGARPERDDGIRSIPHYDEDLDDPAPPEIADLRNRVTQAGGLLIACPTYNGTVTGAMKDWIDWVSRPFGRSALRGVPLAIMTASPGSKGGVQAATYLERITQSLGATLVAEPLTIAGVGAALDADGRPDVATTAAIRQLAEALLGLDHSPAGR